MNYDDFLNRVIDEGIAAAKRDYANSRQKQLGAVAGFEACRGKSPDELQVLLRTCALAREDAQRRLETEANAADGDYWWYRCYEAEVEWVCNVVSVVLVNKGAIPIVPPTCRAGLLAATILNGR